ncbi:MAG: tetratricopeptide repeat protein [Elusimicrobiota bacterium]
MILSEFINLALALGLAILFLKLGQETLPEDQAPFDQAFKFIFLASFCRVGMRWNSVPTIQFALLMGVLGAGIFALLNRSARTQSSLRGFTLGLVFSTFCFLAYSWGQIATAWKMLGWFSGDFLWETIPFWLAASFAAVGFALLHREVKSARPWLIIGLFIIWWLPARFVLWRLKTVWGYGPKTLAEAVGAPSADHAIIFKIIRLRSLGSKPYESENSVLAENGVSTDDRSLKKIFYYLQSHQYRTIYAGPAISALRRGWLKSWDPHWALWAASLAYPGRLAPDYLTALGLIRAGPLSFSRYQALRRLDALALTLKDGFENVTQSQRIFEAFEKAYARFGDEQNADFWLSKVDNLWPVYEEQVKSDPIQNFMDGTIRGRVLLDGRPDSLVSVGLFFLGISTSASSSGAGILSDAQFPDRHGDFYFYGLGTGRYYLSLQGPPSNLGGPIIGSPGILRISPSSPIRNLPPIYLSGRRWFYRMNKSIVELERKNSELLFQIGLKYFEQGDYDKAMKNWIESETIYPGNRKAREALKFLTNKGRSNEKTVGPVEKH